MNEMKVNLDDFITVMNECGFDLTEETMDEELQYDSLQFVSTMVAMEEYFGIQIPDQFLLAEGLNSSRDIFNMIQQSVNLKS